MSYKIQSSEKTRAKCSEYETRALLHIMNCMEDSNETDYFVVDFFNDLTAIDSMLSKSWDLQSKGKSNNFHSDIGKELVTLLKNFLSEIDFDKYILFLGGVVDSVRIDSSLSVFDHSNIHPESLTLIKKALVKEANKKSYITSSELNNDVIEKFLQKITFVIGDRANEDYVLDIIKVNPNIYPSKVVLKQIFKTIRDAQSGKKNSGNIEGEEIENLGDFIFYDRHIRKKDITLLVLNRIVNNDIMKRGVTPAFEDIYFKLPDTERKDMIEDCKLSIAKTLFDKNNSEYFWTFFGNIYEIIFGNNKLSIDSLFKKVDKSLISKLQFMDFLSVKYLIAVIKDGIDEDY